MMRMAAQDVTPVAPGEQTVQVEINATYELTP